MQMEDYFLFLEPTDIRIKGHRIGIETVLDEYLTRKRSPEEIQCVFPTLTLEQVYATILYYLQNREGIGKYMEDWWNYSRQARENAARNPSERDLRRMALREEIASYAPEQQDEARQRIIARERALQDTRKSETSSCVS